LKKIFLIVFDYGLSQSIPIHTLLPMLEITCSNNESCSEALAEETVQNPYGHDPNLTIL